MEIPDIEWESSGLPYDDHFSVVVPHTQLTPLRPAVQPKAAAKSYGSNIYFAVVL